MSSFVKVSTSLNLRRLIFISLLVTGVLCFSMFYMRFEDQSFPDFMRHVSLGYIDIHQEVILVQKHCIMPKFDLYPSEAFKKKYCRDEKKEKCPGTNWVQVRNGVFRISEYAQNMYDSIWCNYTPILRGKDDFKYNYGEVVINVTDGWNVTTEGSKVSCTARNASENASYYDNYHLTVPYIEKLHQRGRGIKLPNSSLGMNVLFFGYDSVSRMTWLRKLPKTYAYLRDVLGSIVLEDFNTVADGTLGAFIPILTGHSEGELPSTTNGRKKKSKEYMDGDPWIWNDFEKAGYVHQFSEDVPTSTWTWRLKGFKKQPNDHNILHFYKDVTKFRKGQCVGAKYRHSLLLDYMADFEEMYRDQRRFSFSFSARESHEGMGLVHIFDDETKEWLQKLHEGGYLNNTLLFIACDHGARYNGIRETLQGVIEERNPFVSIRVPPWFNETYPDAYKNILINSKRLTTPFDIHETLRDILDFEYKPLGNVSQRGISLFSEIPVDRLCSHADVSEHWCNCLDWTSLNIDSNIVKGAATGMVKFVNNVTNNERAICHPLKLDYIIEAKGLKNLKVKAPVSTMTLQVVLQTKPGKAHYQVTVKYDKETQKYNEIKVGDISRINSFGHDADCLVKDKRDMSIFCYCRKTSDKSKISVLNRTRS